jgi:putative sterol carrier protein
MTRRRVGAIGAAAFAIGLVSGAAGTIVAHDATPSSSDLAAVMAGYDMDSMMSGSMGWMMGWMMGPGSSFGAGMMSGPAASSMPGSLHDLHHPTTSPDGAK